MKTLRIENRWNKESSNFAIASFQTFKLQQSLHALHVLAPPHNLRPNQPARKGLLFCFNPCECIQCHYILYNSQVLSTSVFFYVSGAQTDTWNHSWTTAREHHQWLWSRALQESSGPCSRGSGMNRHVSLLSHFCNSTKTSPFSVIPSNCK